MTCRMPLPALVTLKRWRLYIAPLCVPFFSYLSSFCVLPSFSPFVTCSHSKRRAGKTGLFSFLYCYTILLLLTLLSLSPFLWKSALNRCKRQPLQRGGLGASSECLGADGARGCGLLPHCPSSRRANSASIISCIVPRRSMRSSWILRFCSRRSPERFVLFVIINCLLTLFIGRRLFFLLSFSFCSYMSVVFLWAKVGCLGKKNLAKSVKNIAKSCILHIDPYCKIGHNNLAIHCTIRI